MIGVGGREAAGRRRYLTGTGYSTGGGQSNEKVVFNSNQQEDPPEACIIIPRNYRHYLANSRDFFGGYGGAAIWYVSRCFLTP